MNATPNTWPSPSLRSTCRHSTISLIHDPMPDGSSVVAIDAGHDLALFEATSAICLGGGFPVTIPWTGLTGLAAQAFTRTGLALCIKELVLPLNRLNQVPTTRTGLEGMQCNKWVILRYVNSCNRRMLPCLRLDRSVDHQLALGSPSCHRRQCVPLGSKRKVIQIATGGHRIIQLRCVGIQLLPAFVEARLFVRGHP